MRIDESLPLMLWTARPDLSCDGVSAAWLHFTGLSAEQALGSGWSRAIHPEDLARWLDTCVRAFDAREPFTLEYRLRRRDGQYRWMLDRAVPRRRDGVFVGFAGVCVDIDEAKRRRQDRRGRVAEASQAAQALEAIERNARLQSRIIANLQQLLQPGQAPRRARPPRAPRRSRQ